MAKPEIPESLKAQLPQTTFGKLLSATPVVMAVIATLLAGLSSSEMTRAQYNRSLAAQQQSKAGDQWSFFQAKKLRAALQLNTLDVVQTTTEPKPLTASALRQLAGDAPAGNSAAGTNAALDLDSPTAQRTLAVLQAGILPALPASPTPDPLITTALQVVRERRPEAEVNAVVAKLTDAALSAALRTAQDQAQAFDQTVSPMTQWIDQMERALALRPAGGTGLSSRRDFIAARLRFNGARYEAEARLNQIIADLHEVEVRHSNLAAERHRVRSGHFFFGMLAAQAAVIISTLAMAARQRNLLWSLAAVAGLAAVAFAIYVYLWL